MLCSKCEAIFQGGAERFPSSAEEYFHHTSAESFKAAIQQGCRLCQILMEILPQHIQQLDWKFHERVDDETPEMSALLLDLYPQAPDNMSESFQEFFAHNRACTARSHDAAVRASDLRERTQRNGPLESLNVRNKGWPWEVNNSLVFSRDHSPWDPVCPAIRFSFLSAKGRMGINYRSPLSMPWEIYLVDAKHVSTVSSPNTSSPEADYRAVPQSTVDSRILRLAQHWLAQCDEHHQPQCRPQASFLPTRLLRFVECEGLSQEENVQLCLPDQDKSVRGRYMTLSHRWPALSQLKAMTAVNMSEFLKGVPLRSLPPTFQDALRFAKSCGVDYVWIDALCIQQGNKEDLRKELDSMGLIYHEAYCNLSASRPDANTTGLFQSQTLDLHVPFTVSLSTSCWKITEDKLCEQYVCVPRYMWRRSVDMAVVNTRGWVFQERYLSRRKIFFTSQQVFWECRKLKACDMFQLGIPRQFISYSSRGPLANMSVDREAEIDKIGAFTDRLIGLNESAPTTNPTSKIVQRRELLKFWSKVLEMFSELQLTYEEDRLAALRSVVQHLERAMEDELVFGLWRSEFPYQLIFKHNSTSFIQKRQRNHEVPSWSWAYLGGGLDGVPTSRWNSSNPISPLTTVLSLTYNTDLEEADVGGPTRFSWKATLRLWGFIFLCSPDPAERIEDSDPQVPTTQHFSVLVHIGDEKLQIRLDLEDLPVPLWDSRFSLHVMPMYQRRNQIHPTWEGLVLMKILDLGDIKRYYRLGTCAGRDDVYEAFQRHKTYFDLQEVAHLI